MPCSHVSGGVMIPSPQFGVAVGVGGGGASAWPAGRRRRGGGRGRTDGVGSLSPSGPAGSSSWRSGSAYGSGEPTGRVAVRVAVSVRSRSRWGSASLSRDAALGRMALSVGTLSASTQSVLK
jgi:hypothetical protein